MIITDDRVGAVEYAPLLRSFGLPVEVARLEFGDFCWAGCGPDERTLQVGVELKRLPDLLQSFASGRLINHQLPGMTNAYDMPFLVVEGIYRAGASGILEWRRNREWTDAGYGNRRWTFREIESRLTTMELKAGVHVRKSATDIETALVVAGLYEWFTNSTWDEHRSHLAMPMKTQFDMLRPPTLRERVAAQLPGLGPTKAAMAAGAFGSVAAMMNATEEDWARLPKISRKQAKDIVAAIRG